MEGTSLDQDCKMADQIQMASPEEVDLELEDDTDAYRSNVGSSALSTDDILSKLGLYICRKKK